MTFNDVLLECCQQKELVDQFNRLTGCKVLSNIYDTRPPIVRMIDESTGYQKILDQKAHEDFTKFLAFVYDCVWIRLPVEIRN